ncbi:hypothetical protein, partial [Paraeggerthella sp.]|uniref:hypothetical protein n=1 Tax=Paraeggerthella sp. TaxID=2897350 RepID=UPI003A8D7DFA
MEKTNNKKLIASATLIVASIALLLGLTFAWFTDTVANKGNKIQAGTLKVQLYDTVTTASGTVPEKEITNAGEAIFGIEELREPGARTAEHVLRVANNGSVALKYEISFQKIDEGPSGSAIENVIDVYLGGQKSGVLADYLSGAKSIVSPDGVLAAGASTTLPRVQLAMQETAGNQYQGMQTQFDVILVATQATGEADGFGNVDYDKDATYPWDGVTVTPVAPDSNGAYNLSSGAELAWVSQEVASGTFGSARSGAGPVVVLQNDIDLGGNEWIPIGGDVAFTGTFDGNGHTITGLTASSNALADDPTRGVALFGYAENATIKNLK